MLTHLIPKIFHHESEAIMATKQSQLVLTEETTLAQQDDPMGFMLDYLVGRPEFEGTINKFPQALLLNSSVTNPGLFIKQSDLARAGWNFSLPHNGVEYTHTFGRGGGGQVKQDAGLYFKSPHMVIVAQSSRKIYVEKADTIPSGQDPNGEKAYLPKYAPIGVYADEDGNVNQSGKDLKEYYDQLYPNAVTLRTIYLIILVNEDNQELHKIPIALTVKGAAAASFGNALENFHAQWFSLAASRNPSARPLNVAARSLYVFCPTFEAGQTSQGAIVCKVAKDEQDFTFRPFCKSAAEIDSVHERFNAIREINRGFDARFDEQVMLEVHGKTLPELTGVDPQLGDIATVDASYTLE
jgi:hypothetical protein